MATGSKASADAIKAGEAFVELNADDSKFRKVMDRAAERFKRFGAGVRNIGVGSIAIGTAIVAPLAAASVATLKYLDSIQDIADRTNSSTEAVSRLAYAAKLSASSIEDVEAANKVLTRSTLAAIDGSEDQSNAFKKLGIDAKEFIGLNIDEKFFRIAQALDNIDDEAEKAKFVATLFGKQASTMLPLLKEGANGMRNMFDEAEKLGAVISSDDGKKAAKMMDDLDRVMTSLKSTVIEVALAVLTLGDSTDGGLETLLLYLKLARDWIKENKKLVATIAIVGVVLLVIGGILVVLGLAISAIGVAIAAFVKVVVIIGAMLAIVSVKGLVLAGIVILIIGLIYTLGRKFLYFTELGGKIRAIFGDMFGRMGDTFHKAWNGILGALRKGDFELAWKIIVVGMQMTWLDIVMSMKEAWFGFINYFVFAFKDAVTIVKVMFWKLVNGIKELFLSLAIKIGQSMIDIMNKLDVFNIFGDTITGLQDGINQLDKDMKAIAGSTVKIEAEAWKELDEFKDAKKKAQQSSIDETKTERDNWLKLLEKLQKQANEPLMVEPVLPVAPMPHEKGKKKDNLSALGDSVRGLFDSSDFRGVLAIGDANSYAKEQRDLLKEIKTELSSINSKVGIGEFV